MFFVSKRTKVKVDLHLPARLEISHRSEELIQHALESITQISRTFKGESNTDISEDKVSLLVNGDTLRRQVSLNYLNTLKMLFSYPDMELDSASKVAQLIGVVGLRLNEKLTHATRGFWRTWETPFEQTPVDRIKKEFRDVFCVTFMEKFSDPKTNPIEFAYWIEQYGNAKLHPLNDGCGRLTKALAAWVLGRMGLKCAKFETREEYFKSLLKDDGYLTYRDNVVSQNKNLPTRFVH